MTSQNADGRDQMVFEAGNARTAGGGAPNNGPGASTQTAQEDGAAASTYPSHGANHRQLSPSLSASSNSSGFYTKNTFNSHQSKKTVFERFKHQAKVVYLAQMLFGSLWIICSFLLLRPPVHCIATACLTILQASFALWARSNWIEKEQTLARKIIIYRACLLLSLMIAFMEFLHFLAAICRVPLYTAIELRSGYLPRSYRHSDLQVAFTYVLSASGTLFAALNVFVTYKLVKVCQYLHSNVHIVLGYDQQIGYIFQPINVGQGEESESSGGDDKSSSVQGGGEGGQRVESRSCERSYVDAEEMFFRVEKDNDSLIYVNETFNAKGGKNREANRRRIQNQSPGYRH